MSEAAREAVLSRIRGALSRDTETALEREADLSQLAPESPTSSPKSTAALFAERLQDYDAEVYRCTAADLGRTIREALAHSGVRRLLLPEHSSMPIEAAPEMEIVLDRELPIHELDRCDAVVTGCTMAIAETGTIVLQGGPEEGRRAATLVPDTHICIVHEEQIMERVIPAFQRIAAKSSAPMTFVSGPSATADIEMTRIKGVHGPRFLYVVLVASGA